MSGFSQSLTGFRLVATRLDDTLQQVAARELGDASQWPVLANINNLLPPYLTQDPSCVTSRVLLGGTQIKVPGAAPANSAVVDPSDVFGTDIALVDGQIVDDGAGDVMTVTGVANLQQALENRLATRPGELVFHLAYGCRASELKGQGGSATTNGLAALYVSKALQADPRVDTVPSCVATITGDTINTVATAMTVDGKSVPVGNTGGVTF
jgi:phage baseplate assembly protein W